MTKTLSKRKRKPDTVKVGSVAIKIYKRTRATVTGGTRTIWEVANHVGGRRRLQSFSDFAAAWTPAEEQTLAGICPVAWQIEALM